MILCALFGFILNQFSMNSLSSNSCWIQGNNVVFPISAVKQEFHFEEDSYYTEDEYVEEGEEEEEEEDASSSPEKGSKKKARGRANGEPRMKMRRIFRITHGRERQRGEVGGGSMWSKCSAISPSIWPSKHVTVLGGARPTSHCLLSRPSQRSWWGSVPLQEDPGHVPAGEEHVSSFPDPRRGPKHHGLHLPHRRAPAGGTREGPVESLVTTTWLEHLSPFLVPLQ